MSVNAIASVAGQVAVRYAAVAPVSRAKLAHRVAAAKSGQKAGKRKANPNSPKIEGSRSPAASSSSAVLAALIDLRAGG